jgi:hypothetical protein
MTVYICFGPYAGWHLFFDKGIRLVLGWISFSIVFLDIEDFCGSLKKVLDLADADVVQLRQQLATAEGKLNRLANTKAPYQAEPRMMIFMENGVIQTIEADLPVSVILEDQRDNDRREVKYFHPNLRLDAHRSGFDSAWADASAEADQYELSEGVIQ